MIVAFFSGGKDSAVASHIAYTYAKKIKEEFKLVHVNTKINITETEEFVKKFADWLGVELTILEPKGDYWEYVKKWGYPMLPNMRWCFHHLKQDPIIEFMYSEFKKGVLYPTYCLGIRRDESRFRFDNYEKKWYFRKDHKITYKVWLPILYWNDQLIFNYIKKYNIPINPVWKRIGLSGECLCMSGASLNLLNKVLDNYPEIAELFAKKDKEVLEFRKKNNKPIGYPAPLLALKIPLHKYIEQRKKQLKIIQFSEECDSQKCMDCFATTLISFLETKENG